jgi:hypothetical protein
MRIRVFVRAIPLLLAVASSTLLRAQFQKPTEEELKMTADPKSPGAAAVFLNVEEIADDPVQYRSFYARIKVLSEMGEKVTDIKGRTIHPDGTVIPLRDKAMDQPCPDTTNSSNDHRSIMCKTFTLPSVEVGSIVEYSYRIEYDRKLDQFANVGIYHSAPHWVIQRPYLVHKAHYVFKPLKEFLPQFRSSPPMYDLGTGRRNWTILQLDVLKWQEKLPEGVKMRFDNNGYYIVDLTDVPPLQGELFVQDDLYHVFFHYENVVNKNK